MSNVVDFPETDNLQIVCPCGSTAFDLLFIPENGYFLMCPECDGVVPTTPFEVVTPEDVH